MIMNYTQAINFIHSTSNFFCKPGLERITQLCGLLGNPQDKLKFVHVAGTNGKGSFCAMLSSILIDAGFKVGTFTSPYILNFGERICINGKMITDDDLAEICTKIKPLTEKMSDSPTEFELITAIGFEYFKKQNCDVVILECGLGGKYDATNIIKSPCLSVITGVDFDHQNFLGNTIEKIATEKAGIIKDGIPCLWCGKNKTAKDIIESTAQSKMSKLIAPDYNCINIKNISLETTQFDYKDYKDIPLSLLGVYQTKNAANAIEAAQYLNSIGYTITEKNIKNGLSSTVWRARFEVLSKNPLIIFDGSHNPQGISAALNSIKTYFGDKKVNILMGVMADKDYTFMANTLSKAVNNVYCITPDNPRALESKVLADIFKNLGISAFAFDDTRTAFNTAVKQSVNENKPLICLGSLYMYSQIYNIIFN